MEKMQQQPEYDSDHISCQALGTYYVTRILNNGFVGKLHSIFTTNLWDWDYYDLLSLYKWGKRLGEKFNNLPNFIQLGNNRTGTLIQPWRKAEATTPRLALCQQVGEGSHWVEVTAVEGCERPWGRCDLPPQQSDCSDSEFRCVSLSFSPICLSFTPFLSEMWLCTVIHFV